VIDSDFTALRIRIERIGGTPPAPIVLPDFDGPAFSQAVRQVQMTHDESPRTIVREAAIEQGIDPALAEAVAQQESGLDPNATSNAGAQGLMQLMPATAAALGVGDPYDARENAAGGVRYLRGLLARFDGNLRLALAAYNAGPGAVLRYGGIPPYAQTQRYVADVLAAYRLLRITDR
jgi:soluble lytic murein transglycosylase-like protein